MPADASADPGGAPAELEARVERLVAALTDDELVWVMSGDGPLVRGTRAMSRRYNGEPIVAGEVARLGLPGVRFTDGPRGVVMYHSTAFPSPMARAATFDPALEERVGDAIGVEARAQGANLFAGVCINLLRHPAWGRAQETYGEDPHLLGEMGAALVRGTQRHVMACVKHYALNSMENSRLWLDVRVADADLHDLYLPHFRRCVDEGASAVMTAYNGVNGTACGHHGHLVVDVLKGDWGFDGFVMSDFTWGIRSAAAAVDGGMDLEMPFRWRFRALPRLLRRCRIRRDRLEDSARRLVRQQLRQAERGEPDRYDPAAVAGTSHRALAREVAARSVTLLRNEPVAGRGGPAPVLPLDPARVGSLAVLGVLAAEPNLGDLGSSQVHPPSVVTLLQGLTSAGERHGVDVRHHDGADPEGAAALAAACGAAVVVVGCTWRDEGEWIIRAGGDRRTLELDAGSVALVEAVAAANPATAVLLMGGSAFVTDPWADRVAAIAMVWYPGMEGGHGVADVVFGDAEPEGRLPCTWPAVGSPMPPFRRFARRITYGPLFGYRLVEATGTRPAFPFGFGLGYADIAWGVPQLLSSEPAGGGRTRVVVGVELVNTGDRPGVEVLQCYVSERLGTHPDALRTLRGFRRVRLAAGERARVEVEAVVPSAAERLWLGPSSAAATLREVDGWTAVRAGGRTSGG
ncbi:MAG: glycoside hydrolase family 3 C-terminal domain-containing protein [Microthrixaceae bacterium]